jgi:hypothetical protein
LPDRAGEALEHVIIFLKSINLLLNDSFDVFEFNERGVRHLHEHVHDSFLIFPLSANLLKQVVVGDTALHDFFLIDVEVALVSFKLLA